MQTEVTRGLAEKEIEHWSEREEENADKPRLFAVVVSWNLCRQVLTCIKSLTKQPCIERIILVDNNSCDGTPDVVKEKFPSVRVIKMDCNKGFAAGANFGIREAMKQGAEYVVLANSDLEVPLGAAERIMRAVVEENAAAAGAKLIRKDNPGVLDGAWGVINWRNFISRVEGRGKPDGPDYSRRKRVDYPLGGFLLLDVSVLKDVGFLDESYFAYHEEMELSARLRRAGYKVIYEPVGIPHMVGGSLREAGAELAREYLLARNSVRFVRYYACPWNKFKFWMMVAAVSLIKLPVAAAQGNLRRHLTNIAGWWHGLLGRPFDDKLKARYRLM